MSQTAPPDHDRSPGTDDRARDTDAVTDRPNWKDTVSAVTSVATDAAVEAVTVVGEAVRALTVRTRGQTGNGHRGDRSDAAPSSVKPRRSLPLSLAKVAVAVGLARRTSARTHTPAQANGEVAEDLAAEDVTTEADDEVDSSADPVTSNGPPVAPAEEAPPEVDEPRWEDLAWDEPSWAESTQVEQAPQAETTVLPWLPPADEPVGDDRPWLVRASTVLLAGLAGIVALLLVTVALAPRVVTDLTEAAQAQLILPEDTDLNPLAQRTRIYAADESLLGILHGEEDRNPVGIDRIPDHVWQAIVAAEDRKFFEHEGYDLQGIGRAALANLQAGDVQQGGSTISQQLARMNFEEVGEDVTIDRKITEVVYAIALEERFSKEELLERYANQIYLGAGSYGVQAAAQEFFRKNVGDLEPHESALLAGLIPSPTRYNPRTNPEVAEAVRNSVLDDMVEVGYLSPAEAERYQDMPLEIAPARESGSRDPFIIEAVKREFLSNPTFGATREERVDRLFNGGLRIYSTIDPRLQEIAADVVTSRFPDGAPTAAIASVEPNTGAIKALHAGREFETDQFNIAIQGRRQPGSAFKPIVMAEALSQGFSPDTTLSGRSPLRIPIDRGRQIYEPENYGGASYGDIDMRTATRNSVNTYYVQLLDLVGIEDAIEMAGKLGIDTDTAFGGPGEYGLALVLGGLKTGVTPLEMASAYSTFANDGVRNEPYLIDTVLRGRQDLLQREPNKNRILNSGVNGTAVDLLRGVVEGGTGTAARISGWEILGKTGTTTDSKDLWFAGATATLSTAVWVGHPDSQVKMPGDTGGGVVAPVWRDFMVQALEGQEPVAFRDAETPSFRGRTVTVPDVRGMSESQALATLARVKLIGRVQQVPSNAPAGVVVWASPSGEAQIGSTIYLGVSTGQAPPPPPKGDGGDDDDDDDEDEDEQPNGGPGPGGGGPGPPGDSGPPAGED